MRSKRSMRESRRLHLAAGALMLVIPGSAVALAAGQADAQSAIQINLSSRHLAYGDDLKVMGSTSPVNAGQTVTLQFTQAGSTGWRPLASTRVGPNGHFRFAEPVRRSGLVRAVSSKSVARSSLGTAPGTAALAPSTARPVQVTPKFRVRGRPINALSGRSVAVQGTLLPEVGGRRVTLDGRSGRHWHALTSTRTGRHGGFRLHYRARGLGRQHLRVRFAGDRLNTHALLGAGRVTVFRESVASWYSDGGATACGFHAGYGVANRTLPCGTKVTFRYGGRTVTAVVDDRGPFVGGREWDLNQNTAGALGFGGVATVWSTS
jgi:rare lipoprotein A